MDQSEFDYRAEALRLLRAHDERATTFAILALGQQMERIVTQLQLFNEGYALVHFGPPPLSDAALTAMDRAAKQEQP